jgi:hypothetical protein
VSGFGKGVEQHFAAASLKNEVLAQARSPECQGACLKSWFDLVPEGSP